MHTSHLSQRASQSLPTAARAYVGAALTSAAALISAIDGYSMTIVLFFSGGAIVFLVVAIGSGLRRAGKVIDGAQSIVALPVVISEASGIDTPGHGEDPDTATADMTS